MRERITFLHPQGTGVDPAALDIQDAGLMGPHTEATREDRITLTLDELPSEVADLLQAGFRDLHVRWTSPLKYDTIEPFSSRLSPGLHVSYTPSRDAIVDQLVKPVWRHLPCSSLLTMWQSQAMFFPTSIWPLRLHFCRGTSCSTLS